MRSDLLSERHEDVQSILRFRTTVFRWEIRAGSVRPYHARRRGWFRLPTNQPTALARALRAELLRPAAPAPAFPYSPRCRWLCCSAARPFPTRKTPTPAGFESIPSTAPRELQVAP